MKIVASVAVLLFASALAYAEGPKPCEELKSEIQKKLEANGAKAYTLVGSCEAGTKKIVYSKTSAPPKTPAPAASKPKP